jgi:hypothetical protein
MKSLIRELKGDINDAYECFDSEVHFDECFNEAGINEDNMRIYDVGYIRGMENVLSRLLEISQDYEV